jgi:hypothetical protein
LELSVYSVVYLGSSISFLFQSKPFVFELMDIYQINRPKNTHIDEKERAS